MVQNFCFCPLLIYNCTSFIHILHCTSLCPKSSTALPLTQAHLKECQVSNDARPQSDFNNSFHFHIPQLQYCTIFTINFGNVSCILPYFYTHHPPSGSTYIHPFSWAMKRRLNIQEKVSKFHWIKDPSPCVGHTRCEATWQRRLIPSVSTTWTRRRRGRWSSGGSRWWWWWW